MQYYKNGKLFFVGNYSKGYLKGKEYNEKGELKFEVEYSDMKRNGKGKEYKDREIIFDGEYYNGQKWNGKGKEFN